MSSSGASGSVPAGGVPGCAGVAAAPSFFRAVFGSVALTADFAFASAAGAAFAAGAAPVIGGFAAFVSATAATAPAAALATGLTGFSGARAANFTGFGTGFGTSFGTGFAIDAFFFSTLAGAVPFFAVARSACVFGFTPDFASGRPGLA